MHKISFATYTQPLQQLDKYWYNIIPLIRNPSYFLYNNFYEDVKDERPSMKPHVVTVLNFPRLINKIPEQKNEKVSRQLNYNVNKNNQEPTLLGELNLNNFKNAIYIVSFSLWLILRLVVGFVINWMFKSGS